MFFTYIIRCADGTYYTGWTTNLTKRLSSHNAGTGAKYTRGRGPVSLVYYERHAVPSAARRREWEIKCLSRQEKQSLIHHAPLLPPDENE